jgi:hypothetical protein
MRYFYDREIAPFDLLRWDRDAYYERLNELYFKKFNRRVNILEARLTFIKDGLKIELLTATPAD